MSSIPTTVLDGKGKNASTAFNDVLKFHTREMLTPRVLDVTAGSRISWDYVQNPESYQPVFADICTSVDRTFKSATSEPYTRTMQNTWCDVRLPNCGHDEWHEAFDAVFYDPPYFFGVKRSDDPRADHYGGYAGTLDELRVLMSATGNVAQCIKPGGMMILKCADQYSVPQRKLYIHHIDWFDMLQSIGEIYGFYVFRYHRVSPTAYQVKNRQTPVIAHTYFMVACKQG